VLGYPRTQRFFDRPSLRISQIREHNPKPIRSDVWCRNRRTKIVLNRVIVIDRFCMCDKGRAETETPDTQHLERDLISRELGLEEDVPGMPGTTRSTPLGKELNLDLLMVFVGAWDFWDIPHILEENGYCNREKSTPSVAATKSRNPRDLSDTQYRDNRLIVHTSTLRLKSSLEQV
jgi:hypothetical protein